MTTATEMALQEEIRLLRNQLEYIKRKANIDFDTFLDVPAVNLEVKFGPPETITLPRVAWWTVNENEYGVPVLVGQAVDKADKRLEVSFYATPHPGRGDLCTVLGELYLITLKKLAAIYREEYL